MNTDYIISYDQGYQDWYVTEFYKYFHKELEKTLHTTFQYEPIEIFAKRFNYIKENQNSTLFNWFSLILYNKKTDKFFVHSWYDYANDIVEWSVKSQFNIIKFSAVSNINEEVIQKYPFVQPSVYYLENWSDHKKINSYKYEKKDIQKAYFAGLDHGIRANVLSRLKNIEFFNIYTKSSNFKQKNEYYEELSRHFYGLSLNGAANICYRDLELFGLGILNLRENLSIYTQNPIQNGVHYVEFITSDIVTKILHNDDNVDNLIKEKVEFVLELTHSTTYTDIIQQSQHWFVNNCTPYSQFKILSSMLEELSILT